MFRRSSAALAMLAVRCSSSVRHASALVPPSVAGRGSAPKKSSATPVKYANDVSELPASAFGVRVKEEHREFTSRTEPSFFNDPDFIDFCNGKLPLVVLKNACNISPQDAIILERMGFGAPAGIASGDNEIRRAVHQIWLQSPYNPTLSHLLVGNLDARKELLNIVERVRQTLDLPIVELSYLSYQPGAFYKRHMDVIQHSAHRRVVSWILYLGETPEWPEEYGGHLRVHDEYAEFTNYPVQESSDDDGDSRYANVPPVPGTLVLFDSATVPHEVLETHHERLCVVGWFGEPK